MLTMLRRILNYTRGQRGQVLVMGVGLLIMSLGVIMISVDVAWWLRDKRDAQNDADAIALAAVQDLPDTLAAELSGDDWAVANGVDPVTEMAEPACSDGVIQGYYCFIDQNSDGTDDMVRVKVSRPSNSFIADALGVGSPTLNPSAAAATVYVSGACVMPWGIVGEDNHTEHLFHLEEEVLYVFQATDDFAGGGTSPGNFGALRIYGQSTYRDTIEGNCEPAQQGACTDDPMVFVDGTLVDCKTEPGGMPGPTVLGLDNRFTDSPSGGACDAATYEEALDRVDPGSSTYCPERLVPVAIIDGFPPGGTGDIVVYGIANFYLAGWKGGNGACFILDDGSERCGFVWGYFISSAPVSTAEVVFTRDFIPFAPTGSALVE